MSLTYTLLTVCNRPIILLETTWTLAVASVTAVSAIVSAFWEPNPPVALAYDEIGR